MPTFSRIRIRVTVHIDTLAKIHKHNRHTYEPLCKNTHSYTYKHTYTHKKTHIYTYTCKHSFVFTVQIKLHSHSTDYRRNSHTHRLSCEQEGEKRRGGGIFTFCQDGIAISQNPAGPCLLTNIHKHWGDVWCNGCCCAGSSLVCGLILRTLVCSIF